MTAKILTVDDSASIRLTTRVTLTGAGYQVTEAVDGADGIGDAVLQTEQIGTDCLGIDHGGRKTNGPDGPG